MKLMWGMAALLFLLAGMPPARAQSPLTPPNSRGLNGADTITWSTTGSLVYGVWPVIIGANGVLFASATGQANCDPSGGDVTVKLIGGTGTNPAAGSTFYATSTSNVLSVVAFAGGFGPGTRWLIKPGQQLVDQSSGSVVAKNVSINAQTFAGGYTNIFIEPTVANASPTLGDVINIVFNNPGLPGNPVTVSYTVVSGDLGTGGTGYNALTTHLTSAITANATLAAAKISAWSSSPPSIIQIAQLAGTPASTTLSYTQGSNTETINFGLSQPGSPGPGSLDTSANGAGTYSLTGTQPDFSDLSNPRFTLAPVPGGIVSLSPETTMTNCQPFNITTISGVATGLTPFATYWLNVSLRSIGGKTMSWTNNYYNYVTY